jgi:hypothetical protein
MKELQNVNKRNAVNKREWEVRGEEFGKKLSEKERMGTERWRILRGKQSEKKRMERKELKNIDKGNVNEKIYLSIEE